MWIKVTASYATFSASLPLEIQISLLKPKEISKITQTKSKRNAATQMSILFMQPPLSIRLAWCQLRTQEPRNQVSSRLKRQFRKRGKHRELVRLQITVRICSISSCPNSRQLTDWMKSTKTTRLSKMKMRLTSKWLIVIPSNSTRDPQIWKSRTQASFRIRNRGTPPLTI